MSRLSKEAQLLPSPGSPEHFRQKVAFVFGAGPGGRGLVMGHYERGSHRIVPVEECPVHSARGNRIAVSRPAILSATRRVLSRDPHRAAYTIIVFDSPDCRAVATESREGDPAFFGK